MSGAQMGYCIPCGDDVALNDRGYCPRDRTIAIPPSWGRKGQEWQAGGWVPTIDRPAGYVRLVVAQAPPKPVPQPRSVPPKPTTVVVERTPPPAVVASRAENPPRAAPARPRLSTPIPDADKWTRTPMGERGMLCVSCGLGTHPHKTRGLCSRCWQTERRRAAGMQDWGPRTPLVEVPCASCSRPFKPVSQGRGRPRLTRCSDCRIKRGAP